MAAHRLTSATFNGKVLKSSNNLGEEWMFDYRKDHTVVTDALGRTEVYGFDENRELVYRIDADGQRSDSERDDYGHITIERAPPSDAKTASKPTTSTSIKSASRGR